MNWKKWPYWLKGGVLLPAVVFGIFILCFIFAYKFGGDDAGGAFFMIVVLQFLNPPILSPFSDWLLTLGAGSFSIILPMLCLYFLIGAFLGWSYGKRLALR